jgi:hypothetical protein
MASEHTPPVYCAGLEDALTEVDAAKYDIISEPSWVQGGEQTTTHAGAEAQFFGALPMLTVSREALREFFAQHNPGNLNNVDAILAQYAGNHNAMIVGLQERYGASPVTDERHNEAILARKRELEERYCNDPDTVPLLEAAERLRAMGLEDRKWFNHYLLKIVMGTMELEKGAAHDTEKRREVTDEAVHLKMTKVLAHHHHTHQEARNKKEPYKAAIRDLSAPAFKAPAFTTSFGSPPKSPKSTPKTPTQDELKEIYSQSGMPQRAVRQSPQNPHVQQEVEAWAESPLIDM